MPKVPSSASTPRSCIARLTSSGTRPSGRSSAAKIQVPTRLVTSTMAHRRRQARVVSRFRRTSTGSTAVSVLSVNSCCWPRIASMKPTQ